MIVLLLIFSEGKTCFMEGTLSEAFFAFDIRPSHPLPRELSLGESLNYAQSVGAFCERPQSNAGLFLSL